MVSATPLDLQAPPPRRAGRQGRRRLCARAPVIETKAGSLSEQDFDTLRTVHGDAAARQARRMLRQRAREENFRSIIEADHGLSPQYQMPVHVSPEREYLGSYMDAILETCIQAKQHGVATTTVDGCLRLLAAKPGHRLWPEGHCDFGAIMHCFYHIGEQVTECVIGDPAKAKDELRAVMEISPVDDLVVHNMHDAIGIPTSASARRRSTRRSAMRRSASLSHRQESCHEPEARLVVCGDQRQCPWLSSRRSVSSARWSLFEAPWGDANRPRL